MHAPKLCKGRLIVCCSASLLTGAMRFCAHPLKKIGRRHSLWHSQQDHNKAVMCGHPNSCCALCLQEQQDAQSSGIDDSRQMNAFEVLP